MAGRYYDLAVLLSQRVAQHLPEGVLFHGLLLRLIEYKQSGMIAGRLRAHF